jgi:hypothetical protein
MTGRTELSAAPIKPAKLSTPTMPLLSLTPRAIGRDPHTRKLCSPIVGMGCARQPGASPRQQGRRILKRPNVAQPGCRTTSAFGYPALVSLT